MPYGPTNVFMLIAGFDVLSQTGDITESAEQPVEDTRPLGPLAAWDRFDKIGTRKAMFKQAGWFDDATNGANDALVALGGVDRLLSYGFAGDTIGKDVSLIAGGLQTKYERVLSLAGLHKASAEYAVDGRRDAGKILKPQTTVVALGDSQATPVDNAALSSNGGLAGLHVTALTLGGYTAFSVIVRHSVDNITYADLTTMTAVTAAPASEAKVVALGTTVNRYLAAKWLWTGAGSGPSANFRLDFARR